jgi:uncharacterized protein YggU (UPF0235/DUF167 family)
MKTKSGRVLAKDDIEAIAAEAEEGYDPRKAKPRPARWLLPIRVHPKAARPRLEWDGTQLEVWVHEPAANGAANDALLRAVGEWLGVAPSTLKLVRGATSRIKLVHIGNARLPGPV